MKATCDKPVVVLVLAAGSASRFGSTKQLSEADGVPLVRRATNAAAGACRGRVVLIAGHDWQEVASAGLPPDGFLVRNDAYPEGIGTSLALGVRAVRHSAAAVLVTLADQPLVTAGHLSRVIEAWSGAPDEIVATGFDGTLGPPVLFASGCFEDLSGLSGDSGGKHLLGDPRFRTRTVTFDGAAVDIDTPADLARL